MLSGLQRRSVRSGETKILLLQPKFLFKILCCLADLSDYVSSHSNVCVCVCVCVCVYVCCYVRVYIHIYCMLAYMWCVVIFCYRNVECESKLEDYVRAETSKLLVLKCINT
jgi:hypothetical protein